MNTPNNTSFIQRIFRKFRDFFARLFTKKIGEKSKTVVSSGRPLPPVSNGLSNADWAHQDTMIGTVRNKEQLDYNLSQKCYYVPGRFLPQKQLPITYIALHQRDENEIPCIVQWGQVLTAEVVERGTIPVTMRTGSDPKEPYFYFTVEEWIPTPHRIEIQDTPRGKPLFTYKFLLDHCRCSYELFALESTEDIRLLEAIHALVESDASPYKEPPIFATEKGQYLSLIDGSLVIIGEGNQVSEKIPINLWKNSPRNTFLRLKNLLQ